MTAHDGTLEDRIEVFKANRALLPLRFEKLFDELSMNARRALSRGFSSHSSGCTLSAIRSYHVLIDQIYSQLTSTQYTTKFFESGFGFEANSEYGDLPTFHAAVADMASLVASSSSSDRPRIDMNRSRSSELLFGGGVIGGIPGFVSDASAPRIYEASFDTPIPSTHKLLPSESKRSCVQYVLPPKARWRTRIDAENESENQNGQGEQRDRRERKEQFQEQQERQRQGRDRRTNNAPSAVVVHLAATGDHGFSRRLLAYALPLATRHNIASVILESPFYGARKPSFQNRSKLKTLSDLMLLGKATIEESLYVLKWLETEEGMGSLVMSGVSMGGVHACMTASIYGLDGDGQSAGSSTGSTTGDVQGSASSLHSPQSWSSPSEKIYPSPLGVVPLLAPKSASTAYCRGALKASTSWDGLRKDFASPLRDLPSLLARIERDMQAGNILSRADRRSWELLDRLKDGVSSWSLPSHRAREEGDLLVEDLVELILETYTDLTRFPTPPRADAAVVVGGSDDGYIGTESVRDVGRHLTGSEVRWVKGGHVSSFLMQHQSFVRAMVDCVDRLG